MPSYLQQLCHGKHGSDKLEWRPYVFSSAPIAVVYRLSALGYCVPGALCVFCAEHLRRYDSGFWWCMLGLALVAQGIVAYLSDVVAWGQDRSVWKEIDPKMASVLFVFFGPGLGARAALGLFVVPSTTIGIWLGACVLACFCKSMGAQASYRQSCCVEEVLLWHIGWHLLPLVAAFCVLDLTFGWTHTLA